MVFKDIRHQVQQLEKIAKTSFYLEKSKNFKKSSKQLVDKS